MALNINGTTGISGVDGSVSAPAVTGTDSNTGITFPSADTIKFSTGGIERMSITNNSVDAYYGNIKKFETTTEGAQILNGTGNAQLNIKGGSNDGTSALQFITDDNNANNDNFRLYAGANNEFYLQNYSSGSWDTNFKVIGEGAVMMHFNGSKKFQTTTSGITVTGSVSETSDIAYKTDVKDIEYGLDLVKKLKPRKFKFQYDLDTKVNSIGFIAQEIETLVPEIVTGEKGFKSLSYSHLTPILTKALQEAIAKIETLETKVAALEAG